MSHALRYDGAAYNDNAELINPDTKVTAGEGRALCRCGEISPVLASGKARRTWFKEHKIAALDAEVAAERTEMETIMGQDVLAGTPEDEVQEALAELVEAPKPAKPAKAPRKAKPAPVAAGPDGEPHTSTLVSFTNTVSPHFWFQLGKPAAKVLREKHPELTVTMEDRERVVRIEGPAPVVEKAAAELAGTYAAAKPAFEAWKKANPEYGALRHTVTEDRRVSYQLTKAYFGNFARHSLLGEDA